jgi:hypothetical protein
VSHGIGFLIESLVAVLLMLTIGYCMILNNRLKRLKADETTLKATIVELVTATEIAERAVAGLKVTAHECEATLGERLKAAERFCDDMNRQVRAGDLVINRLTRIVAAARKSPETDVSAELEKSDPKSLAAAARAFADRARERVGALAA